MFILVEKNKITLKSMEKEVNWFWKSVEKYSLFR